MTRSTDEFTRLLKPHYNDALKYCRALCSGWSPDDAEDVLQQSLLLALENFEALKDLNSFRSWFFKIITTTFYTAVRKHFWKKFLPVDSMEKTPPFPDVYNRAEQAESRMLIFKALSRLGSRERVALLLFEIAGFSLEEIKTVQRDSSLSAVKSRLARTRSKLKKYISRLENNLSSPGKESNSGEEFTGDLEYETIKLISEIRNER